MMVTKNRSGLYSREFDGSNWSDETRIRTFGTVYQFDWDVNSNGKAVMALSTQPRNPNTNFIDCALTYLRYDGTRWDRDSVTTRLLSNPNNNYFCANVRNLDIALAGDDSLLMTWSRNDLGGNYYYNYCESNNQCNSLPQNSASSFGSSRRVAAIGLGNDDEGKVLTLDSQNPRSVFVSGFSTQSGSGSAINIAEPQGNSSVADMALNDAKHSLAVFNKANDLKARFYNGSSWSQAHTLGQINSPFLTLQAQLSDGADYGLTLWNDYDRTNDQAYLSSNISDAGVFEASSTQHLPEGEFAYNKFSGDINDNGKAVIAWFGYSLDANNNREPVTLYSRIYDGNRWLDVEVIDNNIDPNDLSPLKVGVYIDNSDEVTLVYTAKKTDQDIQTEPAAKLFYSRFSTN